MNTQNSTINLLDLNIRINSANRHFCAPDWSWDSGISNIRDMDIWCVVSGTGTARGLDQSIALHRGDTFLITAERRFTAEHDPSDPLVVLGMHFDFLETDGSIKRIPEKELPPFHRRMQSIGFFSQLFDRMLNAHRQKNAAAACTWAKAILAEILLQDRLDSQSAQQPPDERRVEEICDEILRLPAHPWNVEELSRRMFWSRHHFSRIFKRVKGVSPQAFILQARIDAAAALLLESSHSVQRISELTGYADVYFFSRQFKEKTGLNPTQFRRKRGNRSGSILQKI